MFWALRPVAGTLTVNGTERPAVGACALAGDMDGLRSTPVSEGSECCGWRRGVSRVLPWRASQWQVLGPRFQGEEGVGWGVGGRVSCRKDIAWRLQGRQVRAEFKDVQEASVAEER